jgi:hypothetical protein
MADKIRVRLPFNKTIPPNIDFQLATLITESHDPSIPVRQKIITLSSIIARLIWENDFPVAAIITEPLEMPDFAEDVRKRLTGLFADHYTETGRDPLRAEHSVHRFLGLIQGEIAYARNAGKEFPDKVVEGAFETIMKKDEFLK